VDHNGGGANHWASRTLIQGYILKKVLMFFIKKAMFFVPKKQPQGG
jgi:hypothetical protein